MPYCGPDSFLNAEYVKILLELVPKVREEVLSLLPEDVREEAHLPTLDLLVCSGP